MLFTVGSRIQLIHTGDEGVVTQLLPDGMIEVRLDDAGLEIPVSPDNIRSLKENSSSVKAKIVSGKKEKKLQQPYREAVQRQYTILKPQGLQLAFDPVLRYDTIPEGYRMYLINDWPNDLIFALALHTKAGLLWKANGRLNRVSYQEVKGITYDQLNDALEVKLQVWPLSEKGSGTVIERQLKIKPKQFFKNLRTAPLLDRRVHLYKLLEKLEAPPVNKSDQDLRSYTKSQQRPSSYTPNRSYYPLHEVAELANFKNEIDLHINKLVDDSSLMSPQQIVNIQLDHFEFFMKKAIRLGVERVFIIHGLGEGRLKQRIHARLAKISEVRKFVNEFHPRYGWGATEVIL